MTPFAEQFIFFSSLGIVVLNVLFLAVLAVWFAIGLGSRHSVVSSLFTFFTKNVEMIGFVVAVLAFFGSLIFSNIIGFEACELCWWQRILIYPQVVVFGVAWYEHIKHKKRNEGLLMVALILSLIGLLFGGLQTYSQFFNPELLGGCIATSVSCTKLYFLSFGYITIPFMSLSTFLFLSIVLGMKKLVRHA